MAFIPYTSAFTSAPNPSQHLVVKARALSLQRDYLALDRSWQGSDRVSFDYAVVASGTRLQPPGSMHHDDKASGVDYFKSYQNRVKTASSIVIVGGGAVGVQLATDLKEVYPEKHVTLVHSREKLMPLYHEKMNEIIQNRFKELGVKYDPYCPQAVALEEVVLTCGQLDHRQPCSIPCRGTAIPREIRIAAEQWPDNHRRLGHSRNWSTAE